VITLRKSEKAKERKDENREDNMGPKPDTIPLWDFTMPDLNAILPSIVGPVVKANNFPFNSIFITLFQQDQFWWLSRGKSQ